MSPVPSNEFAAPPDLTNPAVVAKQCLDMAGGLEQQATASRTSSAMGGHPYPEFFFRQVAATLKAAAMHLSPSVPASASSAPVIVSDPTTGATTVESAPAAGKSSGKSR